MESKQTKQEVSCTVILPPPKKKICQFFTSCDFLLNAADANISSLSVSSGFESGTFCATSGLGWGPLRLRGRLKESNFDEVAKSDVGADSEKLSALLRLFCYKKVKIYCTDNCDGLMVRWLWLYSNIIIWFISILIEVKRKTNLGLAHIENSSVHNWFILSVATSNRDYLLPIIRKYN